MRGLRRQHHRFFTEHEAVQLRRCSELFYGIVESLGPWMADSGVKKTSGAGPGDRASLSITAGGIRFARQHSRYQFALGRRSSLMRGKYGEPATR